MESLMLKSFSAQDSWIPKMSRKPSCFVEQKPRSVSEEFQSNMGNRRRSRSFNNRVQQVVVANPSALTILTWLIDNNAVFPREKVYNCSRKGSPPVAQGCIHRGGIKCNCCGKVYTLSGFEFHVSGKCSRSAAKIFLEDGRSLLDCQIQILYNQMKGFAAGTPERLKVSILFPQELLRFDGSAAKTI
ncbi:hypothetical protein RCOM_0623600 [Ricinus communis]|uniref:Tify domain-containing protein n=1 Tax=Ricinus communis TaxID=3988 RepID=B9STT1_RICCO|nr:hypothetical protein RCOM_0623600 [Ricinus communis]